MMNPFLYSKDQAKVLEKAGTLANIAYQDVHDAIHTLVLSIRNNITSGQASIVVAPHIEDRKLIVEMLGKFGMSQLCLEIKPAQFFNDADLRSLQKYFTSPPSKTNEADPAQSEFIFRQSEKEILSTCHHMYKPVFGQGSWKELLHQYLITKSNENIFILHADIDCREFQFDKDEYEDVLQSVEAASFVYQRTFDLLNTNHYQHDIKNNEINIDRIQDLTYALFNFKEEALELRDQYYNCRHDIEMTQWKQANEWMIKTEATIDFLIFNTERHLQKYQDNDQYKGILTVVLKRDKTKELEKKALMDAYNAVLMSLSEKIIIVTLPVINDLNVIISNCKDLKKAIATWGITMKERITTFIKASNKINLNNEHMKDLEFGLQSLLGRINEANIFVKPFEINTISFRKQVDFVSNLVHELDIMMLRISQNIDYYQWLSFLTGCNERMKKVIQVLRKFDPEDWVGIFNRWYYYEALSRNVHSEIALNPLHMMKANKLHQENQQNLLHHVVHSRLSDKQQTLTALKQTNPELYQAIVKNKKYQESPFWKHMLEENSVFFSLCYPIIILDDDDIKNVKPGHYNALYYVNPTTVNVDILQDYKTIHTYKKEEDSEGLAMDALLKSMYNPFPELLSSLTLSERMPVIKKLVNHLLSVGKEPVVFHLRHSSIISYGGDFFNSLFEEKLYHFGIKKILLDQNVSDTLVATLLDVSRTAFIITEDLLLHPEDAQSYLWQSQIIQQTTLAGCQWLNIDHMQLFYKDMEVFDLVLDTIKEKNEIKTDPKKQIVIEFNA